MVLRAVYHAIRGFAERRLASSSGKNPEKYIGLGISRPHVWNGRAGLLDLDLNFHMNNASYLYCAELARWHLSAKNGLLSAALRRKWLFMVGSQAMRYRRAIPPFAKYQVWTVLDSVDDRWLYMTQTFTSPVKEGETPKRVYAQATVRAILVGTNGEKVSPEDIFAELDTPADVAGRMKKPNDVPAYDGFLSWDAAVDVDMKNFKAE
mmetsp:Transcript_16081/g.21132  ORF Transcript_16081/g.21132 Transcript_16081/m.21132 type:complete len:207 (+) Transcript_16081:83-703(+)|eukprot:CAMPEP_0184007962 /NCGR_PEP_ID=MMETSP0954-20121128/1665_1 /TAXON_ID=627963 /ORGANISM="Aplanochytrium sp, Strain PBS07" /LENGTH=206 /DNA_ID=CAMNT_0026286931 /DNA_START=566 /DNA_END=1186 /DNA_ORIENTATION=-